MTEEFLELVQQRLVFLGAGGVVPKTVCFPPRINFFSFSKFGREFQCPLIVFVESLVPEQFLRTHLSDFLHREWARFPAHAFPKLLQLRRAASRYAGYFCCTSGRGFCSCFSSLQFRRRNKLVVQSE